MSTLSLLVAPGAVPLTVMLTGFGSSRSGLPTNPLAGLVMLVVVTTAAAGVAASPAIPAVNVSAIAVLRIELPLLAIREEAILTPAATPDVSPVEVRGRGAPEQREREPQLVREHRERQLGPGLASVGEAPQRRAPDQHRLRPQSQ